MILIIGLALVVLADFEFSRETLTEEVNSKEWQLENRQSTGRNYYYTAHIKAGDYIIPVSKVFGEQTKAGHTITFEKSLVFNEVNKVTNQELGLSERYSFRWMTGCIIPLFSIVIMVMGIKRREKVSTLVFVAQAVLLLDFIFLLN